MTVIIKLTKFSQVLDKGLKDNSKMINMHFDSTFSFMSLFSLLLVLILRILPIRALNMGDS